jgi:lauroyl/myristoyl acyltransferase
MLLGDLSLIGKLTALTGVVWATPPRYWRHLAGLGISPAEGRSDSCRIIYRRALGIEDEESLSALCAARRVCLREAKIQVMGLAGPWRRWRPPIRLIGEGHLKAALARRKGVILWASPFLYSHLVFKMALHLSGYRVTQLSRPAHGFGGSRVAINVLNPVWMRVEERFLRERVMIRGADTQAPVKRLYERLAENGIVVITVGNEARHVSEVPFLRHRLRLAAGPVGIAQSSGATLLPAFAVRDADGAFEVTLEEPLPVPPLGAGREHFYATALALGRRIEAYARRFPEQWGGWNELVPEENLASDEAA